MALKDYPVDIEIDGKQLKGIIVSPTAILRDLPDASVKLNQEVFDHLLSRMRGGATVFPFKATAPGLSVE